MHTLLCVVRPRTSDAASFTTTTTTTMISSTMISSTTAMLSIDSTVPTASMLMTPSSAATVPSYSIVHSTNSSTVQSEQLITNWIPVDVNHTKLFFNYLFIITPTRADILSSGIGSSSIPVSYQASSPITTQATTTECEPADCRHCDVL